MRAAVLGAVILSAASTVMADYLRRHKLVPAEAFRVIDLAEGGPTPMRYVLYVPPGNNEHKRQPLVVFLHGSQEGGTDGVKQLKVGLAPCLYELMSQQPDRPPPFLALFPQAGLWADWSPGSPEEAVLLETVDDVCRRYPVDPDRVYLTGHSLGANGVWSLAARYPDRWAAAVPVCGHPQPDLAARFQALPVWAFQGGKDDPALVTANRRMAAVSQQTGGRVRYTELPLGGHAIWRQVYSDPGLFDWLFQQRRPSGSK